MTNKIDLSIVIPVLNEQENIKELFERISFHLKDSNLKYEIIFVDDCSSDRSLEKIKSIARNRDEIKAIKFSRKFGYQESIFCGMEHSLGKFIITMDSDLQHPPEYILELYKKAKEGFDIVNMVRKVKQNNSIIKRISSALFYNIINKLSPTPVVNESADFRLYNRKVIDSIKLLPEKGLFIRGLVGWLGYNQTQILFNEQPRLKGKSKFNFKRLVKFALKGITNFSTSPLYFSIYIGFIFSLIGMIYGFITTVNILVLKKLYYEGWAIITLLLFVSGLIMIMLGIIGIYLSIIFKEIKMRPRYIVDEYVGDLKDNKLI